MPTILEQELIRKWRSQAWQPKVQKVQVDVKSYFKLQLDLMYPPTIAEVKKAVCRRYDVTREELESDSRQLTCTNARLIAVYLCRRLVGRFGSSFPRIGKHFGRDHSTIKHAVERVRRRRQEDAALDRQLTSLENELCRIAEARVAAVKGGGHGMVSTPAP